MTDDAQKILREKLESQHFDRLMALENPGVIRFVADSIALGEPDSVFVATDDEADVEYVRKLAIENGEETPLALDGHTVHFDGYQDQGRDPAHTKYLLEPGTELGERLNSIDKQEGLEEVRGILAGSMKGKQALVLFYCLGPTGSPFSIPVMQITDSAYVGHSEDMLYRPGYEEFRRQGAEAKYFRVLHSAGRLENHVSADVDQRRIYIDLDDEMVYSVNTQYAGNTVGLKKLSLRLAIRRAAQEGWLAEHMFLMGVHGPEDRVTYFLGAFPSMCGKTSTAMLPGQTIIGDDLAYLRQIGGELRAVNVERGIFGIIQDINAEGDPVIWDVLNKPGEVIFSNILVADGKPYWLGMGEEIPEEGVNHSGRWHKGKTDAEGNEIPAAHKNARYTVRIDDLANRDPALEKSDGVVAGAVIYGGRDSDTCVPVEQSFDWTHGVITKGASIESETTAATIGKTGVRKFNLMSNIEFLSMPLGRYVRMHLDFAESVETPPLVFSTNYFLKGPDGKYLNAIMDKRVWVQWMELRCHEQVDAIRTPTGWIPRHEDLVELFKTYMGKDYSRDAYTEQFKVRIPELLAKYERIEEIYRSEQEVPPVLFETVAAQRERLEELRAEKGDHVSPFDL